MDKDGSSILKRGEGWFKPKNVSNFVANLHTQFKEIHLIGQKGMMDTPVLDQWF